MSKKIIFQFVLFSNVLLLPMVAIGNDSDELEQLRSMVQMLEKKVKALENKVEQTDEKVLSERKSRTVTKADSGGFSIQSSDEQNMIRFRGLIQTDYRAFTQGENDVRGRSNDRAGNLNSEGFHDANDSALVRRARPIIEGTVNGIYDFRFTPDFGGGNVTIFDAFVDARLHPAFKVRAGKYKPFIDLERLQNPADLKFIERSYVTNAILPTRDIGISIFGSVWQDKLNYAVGLNNGATDAGNPTGSPQWSGQREMTAWAFATPFKDQDSLLSGLGFGVGATFANVNGERNLDYTNTTVADNTRTGLPNAYLTEGQQVFFRYGSTTVAHGARTRIAPQASYYLGSLGFIAEYVAESQRVALLNSAISNSPSVLVDGSARTLHHNAWDVAVSYLLTGEEASYRGVKPKKNFDLNNQTWGAWELAFRYSEINLDENTFRNASGQYASEGGTTLSSAFADLSRSASAAHTWTAGVNWYLSQNTRFQLNYLHTSFNGGALVGGGSTGSANANESNVKDRPSERAVFGRLQLTF